MKIFDFQVRAAGMGAMSGVRVGRPLIKADWLEARS
jgi:hypothetical protein